MIDTNLLIQKDERLSGAFTYDFYVQGVRKLIKQLAVNEQIGIIKIMPLDIKKEITSNLIYLNGHSSRAFHRYNYICDLIKNYSDLQNTKSKDLADSLYFKYLFRRYENESLLGRYKGKRSCLIKVNRTLELNQYFIINNHSFRGFTRKGLATSLDYPICYSFKEFTDEFVELDGSHRRSIAYYSGDRGIESLVVDFKELEYWIENSLSESDYFRFHWSTYKHIISTLDA